MASEIIGYIEAVDDYRILARMTSRADELPNEHLRLRPGQVGSYVVIPQQDCKLLALVTAQSTRPCEPDTVYHAEQVNRVMALTAVGTIHEASFYRGVKYYPVVGQAVRMASEADLATIFKTWDKHLSGGQGGHPQGLQDDPASRPAKTSAKSVGLSLGRFAPNEKYEVSLDGKIFCARHAAILGSSGSGKSCTVAQIIQQAIKWPETQVVMFDLHGEYLAAFCGDDGKALSNVAYIGGDDLVLPYWLLKYREMEELFVDTSNHANIPSQQSFLKEALLRLRWDSAEALDLTSVYTVDSPVYFSLEQLRHYANNLNNARFVLNTDRLAFRQTALRHLPPEEQEKLMLTADVQFNLGNPEGEVPHPLYHGKLGGMVNLLDQKMNDRRFDFMLRPIEQAKRSECFGDLFSQGENPAGFSRCLEPLLALLTGHSVPRKNVVLLDLSRIPFETIDITVALLTRLLYELNFWCVPADRTPLLLVYEEAHNYIPADRPESFARRAVERVAKEGRKYGVGALVVSQRPVELSETVLSQCNSFIIMRLSNPADQAYVSKVVSEQFSTLVGTLAQLRPGEAYAVGEAVPMPMRTQVYLPMHAPDSGDANFFGSRPNPSQGRNLANIVESWWRQERPIHRLVPAGTQTARELETVETSG